MSMNNGMNVRLTEELRSRLQKVADKSGLKTADLIRMAVEEYCAKIESDGRITINLNQSMIQGDKNDITQKGVQNRSIVKGRGNKVSQS